MAGVNVVTPNDLGNQFSVGGVTPNEITIKTGSGIVVLPDGTLTATGGSLTVTTEDVYTEFYFANSTNGTAQASSRNMTMTRTAVGRWTIAFASAHPDGVNYHITMTAEEQGNFRDTPDITVVQGTKTANGCNIQITTGDNGGGADFYVDTPFSVGVCSPITVVTGVTLI